MDREGLAGVVVNIQTPDGADSVELAVSGSSWAGIYTPVTEGDYALTIVVTDTRGEQAVKQMGGFSAVENDPPVVYTYEPIPETVYDKNDGIDFAVTVTDEEGNLETVTVIVNTPQGEESLSLTPDVDVWQGSYSPTITGAYTVTVIAEDARGAVTSLELGGFQCIPDLSPVIKDFTIPGYVYEKKSFTVSAEVTDDRGVKEVVLSIEGMEPLYLEMENGIYEARLKITKDGTYPYTLVTTDTSDQVTEQAGTIRVKEPSDGDGGCFTADTLVLLADGSLKPIAQIEVGDRLQGFDFTTGCTVINEVSELFDVIAGSYLLINGNLKVTAEHLFAVGYDEWKTAGELEVGDIVLGLENVEIVSIEVVNAAVAVYNLTVDGTHNYFVTDLKKTLPGPQQGWVRLIFSSFITRRLVTDNEVFLVHNKGGWGGDAS